MATTQLSFHERVALERKVREEWAKLTPTEREARCHEDLIRRVTSMARAVKGRPLWPAWSTGEVLMVAIVLDQPERIRDQGYTIAEAFNRVSLSFSELLAIQRELS